MTYDPYAKPSPAAPWNLFSSPGRVDLADVEEVDKGGRSYTHTHKKAHGPHRPQRLVLAWGLIWRPCLFVCAHDLAPLIKMLKDSSRPLAETVRAGSRAQTKKAQAPNGATGQHVAGVCLFVYVDGLPPLTVKAGEDLE